MEIGSEQYRENKRKINKEGFEGDAESSAAVFVGTKEEVEQARLQAEGEGRATDLESYIRLNKEVVANLAELKESLPEEAVKNFEELKIGAYKLLDAVIGTSDHLLYKDRDGNLALVMIDFKKITELTQLPEFHDSWTREGFRRFLVPVKEKMKSLGFNEVVDDFFGKSISATDVLKILKDKREERILAETRKGFNF